MKFKYKNQLLQIKTNNPNIIILPNKKILIYGGQLESYPLIAIKGNILLALIKLISFDGGINFATLA